MNEIRIRPRSRNPSSRPGKGTATLFTAGWILGLGWLGESSAALLNVAPGYPLIAGAGLAGGAQYAVTSTTTGTLTVNLSPQALQELAGAPLVAIGTPKSLNIHFTILRDSSGNVTGVEGDPAGPELVVTGSIASGATGAPYSGTLLTGEIVAFGYRNQTGTTDSFDFRFALAGGDLADAGHTPQPNLSGAYANRDLGLTLTVEQSTWTDTGTFAKPFTGLPKVRGLGPIPRPAIRIIEKISVSGAGGPYFDANQPGTPGDDTPNVIFPHDACYQLTVTNVGTESLTNVQLLETLLLSPNPIMAPTPPMPASLILNPGDEVAFDATIPGFESLCQPNRCTATGTFQDNATVFGRGSASAITVASADPANLICRAEPRVILKKDISVDGGTTWATADTSGAPDEPVIALGSGVLYRLVVQNIGGEALANATITDPTLGLDHTSVPGGAIAPGETRTLTATDPDFAALNVPNRCSDAGEISNTAEIAAMGSLSALPATATDSAYLRCAALGISVRKQVSVDNLNFYDADLMTGADVPTIENGDPVYYRLIVQNVGAVSLNSVVLDDPALGLSGVPLPGGTLTPDQTITVTAGDAGYSALTQPDRCTAAGYLSNTATASGSAATLPAPTPVSDSNVAWISCSANSGTKWNPGVSLKKQISIDNGTTWADADTSGAVDEPMGSLGTHALYRLIVTNTGSDVLTGITISDPTLGLTGVPVPGGDMNPGDTRTLTSASAGFSVLDQPGRCGQAGEVMNTATVDATGAASLEPVSAFDSAYLSCVSVGVDLKKQVSVDNVHFFDANTAGAPDVPSAQLGATAYYRLILTNAGSIALSDILVSDATFGLSNVPVTGTLAPGESTTIDSTTAGFAGLVGQHRCAAIGQVDNTASVSANAATTPNPTPVNASDPAWLSCSSECTLDVVTTCRIVPYGMAGNQCLSTEDTPTVNYAYSITNTGLTEVSVDSVTDDKLGAVATQSFLLAPGEQKVLNQSTTLALYDTPSVTNQVTVSGRVNVANGATCSAQGSATVSLVPTGICALTIGYWKNHASCAESSGNQMPVLDQTLAKAEPMGIPSGILTLHGSTATPNAAPDGLKAIRLLDKSTIDQGKKKAGDPAFNMAAQLLAARLNFQAGAGKNGTVVNAANQAQTLLSAIHFNGISHDSMSSDQKSEANSLAQTLDGYNNGLLCKP